mmetsp:Transcript_14707/g.24135  ORF Transcript_14707/g.24135 Transcript_14707/m.24135 type:complete len:288 (+) Transcript_14707:322-1185(+)
MNIRAMDTDVFADVAAASEAFTAFNVSSNGSSSNPVRNGVSVSATLPTASCTACSFSAASSVRVLMLIFSCTSFCFAFSSFSLLTDACALSSIFSNSFRTRPVVGIVFFFDSINFNATEIFSLALLQTVSVCANISFVISSDANSNVVASSALSTSTSAGVSFVFNSSTSFFAAALCMKSWRAVFKGVSFVCAACSCCSNLPNSSVAAARIFSLSNLLALANFELRKILASPIAVCASLADFSVSSTACLTSSKSSPPEVIISAVMAAFSTASSATFVFWTASGIIS